MSSRTKPGKVADGRRGSGVKQILIRAISWADIVGTDGFSQDFTELAVLPNGAVPLVWMVKVTQVFSMASPFVQLWNGELAQGSVNYVDSLREDYFNAAAPDGTYEWPSTGATLSKITVGADSNFNLATTGALEVWCEYAIAQVPGQPRILSARTGTSGTDPIIITLEGVGGEVGDVISSEAISLYGTDAVAASIAPGAGNTMSLSTNTSPILSSDTVLLNYAPSGGNFLTAGGRYIDTQEGTPVTNNVTP